MNPHPAAGDPPGFRASPEVRFPGAQTGRRPTAARPASHPVALAGACLLAVCLWAARSPESTAEPSQSAPSAPGGLSRIFPPGSSLQDFRIDLTPEALRRLRSEPRQDVSATLQIGGTVFHGTRIHLKGRTGSFRPVDDLPSFTASLTSPHDDRKLHLENSVEDPGRLHQWLGADLFREAGIPMPQVTLGRVFLNGRPLGLYVVREGYDPAFLRNGFGSDAGAVGEPTSGNDIQDPWNWKPGSPGTDLHAAQSALAELAAACRIPDAPARWIALQARLDTDRFATLIAGEVLLEHRDGYALARNNVRVHWNPADGRFTFLPHGMDQLLVEASFPRLPSFAGDVVRAWITTDEGQRAYAERWDRLADEWMNPVQLAARVRTRAGRVELQLTAEEGSVWRRETDDLIRRITRRCSEVALQRSRPRPTHADLENGPIRLVHWTPMDAPAGGELTKEAADTGASRLCILAGPVTAASWQARLTLPAGRYRFEGVAGARNLRPLPFGQNQGVALRVSGDRLRSPALTGDTSGVALHVDFEVPPPGEDLLLYCEVRASAGEAWFASDSLQVRRLD